MKPMENRPNKGWPVGTLVEFLDAWGANPRSGKVVRHYGEFNVLVETERGTVHFGETWRISQPPPHDAKHMFADLIA